MIVEICASNYSSAIHAEQAGAHRIELCAELAVGGITPSYGMIKQVRQELSIPVVVLIRPRSGDFSYSSGEFDIMLEDIARCRDLGCAGVVSGVLDNQNRLDVERTRALVEAAGSMSFTFHRAIDWIVDADEALEQLVNMGVKRVLSSGQATSASLGIEQLKQWKTDFPSLCIMPGGGINASNVFAFKTAGFQEIHASASTIKTIRETPKIPMNSPKFLDESSAIYSDPDKIKQIIKNIEHAT